MFKKKAKNPDKMGLLNLFKWQSSQVSTACNVLILGYFNIFCTDTLLLDPLIMGILMVVSQVVSAVAAGTSAWQTIRAKQGPFSEIAQTIQGRSFESRWRKAGTPEQLQDVFLLGKRRRGF